MTRSEHSLVSFMRYLVRFARQKGGASAVEFALIVPAIAGVAVALSDVAGYSSAVSAMQAAVRASVQYTMNGGTDMDKAKAYGEQAWIDKPAGSTFTAVKYCQCAGAGASCTQPCPSLDPPENYVTVTAAADFQGSILETSKTITQTVRIR